MSTWDAIDHYYSGQGVAMYAERDALGNPKGFEAFGNVSDLKLTIGTSVLEHKESHTGQRGTDLRLTTETKCSLSMTVENFVAKNLAAALRGSVTDIAAASVVAEALKGYVGKVSALRNIKISALVLKKGATSLTPYTNDVTPYDYLVNEDAGSIKLNDGAAVAFAGLGEAVTAVAVGATTQLTVVNSAAVGDSVVMSGFTGADAGLLNGKTAKVLTASGTQVTVDIVTTGKTITATGTPKVVFDGVALTADYSYAAQKRVDALTSGVKELFLRFEGLNTAEDNSPVVVEVFKFNTDPLKELALIGDGVQQFVLEGSVLADNTKLTGSKYFKTAKLN